MERRMNAINTLEDLAQYREQIMALAKQHKAQRIAVFGSIVRGDLQPESDIDFLVDFEADYALHDRIGLIDDLGDLLGRRVDVVERDNLREELAPNILAEETPLGAKTRRDLPPMKRNQRIYCNDILDRIGRIEEYTSGGHDEFMSTRLIQDGVERAFSVIGEAIKQLDPELKSHYPHIPWRGFAGFRDMLAHQYRHIRLASVWRYTQEHVPELKEAILDILAELDRAG